MTQRLTDLTMKHMVEPAAAPRVVHKLHDPLDEITQQSNVLESFDVVQTPQDDVDGQRVRGVLQAQTHVCLSRGPSQVSQVNRVNQSGESDGVIDQPPDDSRSWSQNGIV